jgi:hypothetical protein
MTVPGLDPRIIPASHRLLRIPGLLSVGRLVAVRCGPEYATQVTLDAPHDTSCIL